ncbi:glycosyltransferase family 39 protein [Actinoplanes sp. NPDC026619]|uniref:glycosyltransferase family 39 protein n=1 Tax=Actinoplanes sp. NPDC026619 TaxID=3155798 RepID=UPI0033FCDAC9
MDTRPGETSMIGWSDPPTEIVVREPAPEPPRPDAPSRRLAWVLWALPALVAAALGVWRLTVPALWADELATWGAVRLSWSQLRELTSNVDFVLAPYYAAMKAYTSIAGTSTVALRLPAVIAMIATALLTTALGRRLGGPWVGLFAGLIYALLPVTSRYAQEARSYGFVVFATTLALLCLVRLLERPTVLRAAGYAGALVLAGFSHPLSTLLVLAAHAVAAAWRRSGRAAVFWVPAAVIGGLPALVLTALGSRQRGQLSWIQVLTVDLMKLVPERIFMSGAVAGIVLALAILGVRASSDAAKSDAAKSDAAALAAAGFAPILLLFTAGLFEPIWSARYVLVALPALAVLAAAAAMRFGPRPTTVVVLLLALVGWPYQLDARTPAGHSEDSAKIAAVIEPLYRPGDVAVFADTHPSIPWAARDIYERYLPSPRPPDVLRTEPQRHDGHFLATECPDAACLGTPPRIWVIRVDYTTDPFALMSPAKRKLLSDNYRQTRRWQYTLLTITLLERKPAPKAAR